MISKDNLLIHHQPAVTAKNKIQKFLRMSVALFTSAEMR